MHAILTRDDDPDFGAGIVQSINLADAVSWLESNPRNALRVAPGAPPGQRVAQAGGGFFVLGEGPNDYYYGQYPPRDPDDTWGNDLDAEQAVISALNAASRARMESKDKRPTIDEIARQTPHILEQSPYGGGGYSGTIEFDKDEIDVKGDGTLWAIARYEVDYNWDHRSGDRVTTQPVTSIDVVGVRLVGSSFYTDNGEEVEVPPDGAAKILIDYFWKNGLDTDQVLSDKIHEQAGAARYER